MTGTGPQRKLDQKGYPRLPWWQTLLTDPLLLLGAIVLLSLLGMFLQEALCA